MGAHAGIGRSGPKQALIDLLSTDNLDGLLYDCAPGLVNQANASYSLNRETIDRLKDVQAKLQKSEKYDELKGRYDILQQHYDELKKERDELIKSLRQENVSQR